MPIRSSSAGRSFHCLHATSHALQPMHVVVSVKKPIRPAGRWTATSVGAAAIRSPGSRRRSRRRTGRSATRAQAARRGASSRVGALGVLSMPARRSVVSSRRRPGAHAAAERLGLVDRHVRIPRDRHEVVDRVADDALLVGGVGPEVPRQADLVQGAPADLQRAHAVGDLRARLDLRARRLDHHPAAVLDARRGGQDRVDLREHLRLQLGQPRQVAAHRPGRMVLGQPERRRHVRPAGVAGVREHVLAAAPR